MDRMQYMFDFLYFVHRICTKEWIIAPQRIDFIDITYVYAGRGVYHLDGVAYPVLPGSLMCIPAGTYRVAETDPEDTMRIYAFNFYAYDLKGCPVQLPLPLCGKLEPDKQFTPLLERLNSVWALRRPGYELMATSLLYRVVHDLIVHFRNDTPIYGDERVQHIVDYVLAHINERLTPAQLGDCVSLNPSYLNTLVRACSGKTLTNFVNHIRINVAENILRYEDVTNREVAERCGFSDVFYFCKTFKKHRGYSPGAAKRL